jgi:hypothetical protein
MTVDLDAAARFMAAHARVLDRRRFGVLLGNGDATGLLAALDGYRNPDGGYGWGLEPDLRVPESQPLAALHAFEAFAEAAPLTCAHALALCDWLGSVTRPDGGLPFALPLSSTAGTAPWFAGADPAVSSLQITAAVVVAALAAARHDQAVAVHPWLDRAVRYCLAWCEAVDGRPAAYELVFAVRFLDAVQRTRPEAGRLLERPTGTSAGWPACSSRTAGGPWTTPGSPRPGRWNGAATRPSARCRSCGYQSPGSRPRIACTRL